MNNVIITIMSYVVFSSVTATARPRLQTVKHYTCVSDDEAAPWEDSRLDERIYADTPNFLTYQLNHKRYAVPYHPVARLRASQTAGVVLPYAMIANRNYVNDDGNRRK